MKLANSLITQYIPYSGFVATGGMKGDWGYPDGDGELIHFTAASQRILGRRYFAAYKAALENYQEQPPTQPSKGRRSRRGEGEW